MESYVPLHVHDTYGSIGDSILKIPAYIDKAKKLGLTSLAVTNHGSLSSFVNFYETCRENNIKPIIGCEVYFCDDRLVKDKTSKQYYHLVLLAKNYAGLCNLIKIHNDAHKNGFYYKPRTDFSMLSLHSSNLICLSACIASPIAKSYFNKDYNKMIYYTKRLKDIFGKDFYLEIQPGHFQEQVQYNDAIVSLANNLGIDIVATNDIHYLNREDYITHNFHVKDSRKDSESTRFIYPDRVYYLMNREELADSFIHTNYVTEELVNTALDNTNIVADKCNLTMPEEHFMPVFDKDMDEFKELGTHCLEGFKNYKLYEKPNAQEYLDRLQYELSTIKQLGFSGYFLIVKDIIDYCDREKIPRGPGRGSGAGSLVSYLLGISVADPIKYHLMFERFLSPKRKALPDIDIDLDNEKKSTVYDYIVKKYGENRCCFVATYNMRKARAAIKTACRILNIDLSTSNKISKSIPYVMYDEMGEKKTEISISQAIEEIPEFADLAKQYPDIISVAKSIENYPCSTGIHPAGIIISPVDITYRYPLVNAKDKDIMATSLDLKDVEKLSGVKFDLLSLSSLSTIYKTMEDVGFKFDFQNDKLLNDEKVWKLIASENNAGLFQISSNTYKTRMPLLHPTSIQELAACLALVRGPCISSGMDKVYIDIVNGRCEPEHIHDVYWEATKDTHGVLIYQEQILKICMNIGFDAETSYNILKIISKKKQHKIKEYKREFYIIGRNNNITDDILETIWKKIEDSGLYAFNIAHATSYALLCYCSAYLKTYYPVQYMCNLLTKEYTKSSTDLCVDTIIRECRALNISFLLPDINKSKYAFTVENGKIRMGLCCIKGFGQAAYQRLSMFKNIKDFDWFCNNVTDKAINKRIVLLLIAAGCFHSTNRENRTELAKHYLCDIRKEKEWDNIIKIGNDKKASIDFSKTDKEVYYKLFQSKLLAG